MIKLEEIAPYLPYGLKCQYEGILNGEEIGKWEKEINGARFPDRSSRPYEVIGLKIAPLKQVQLFNNYWLACIGIYPGHLKHFMNGDGFKPILRPLSDLDKDINWGIQTYSFTDLLEIGDSGGCIHEFTSGNIKTIQHLKTIAKYNVIHDIDYLPHAVVKMMIERLFDIHGLIDRGLAIDINTLPPC